MAENKKTFIFYSDWHNMIKEMPNESAGELIKHILLYVNDTNPTTDNILVKMAFAHMEPLLKADLKKWAAIREKRKISGSIGGKANAKQKEANAKQVEAVNVNVNVNGNVNGNDNKGYRKFAHLKLSLEDFKKLNEKYSKESIDDTLNDIENYSQNKKYKSLYLTASKWLKKDQKEISAISFDTNR